jgi:cobalamin synthase
LLHYAAAREEATMPSNRFARQIIYMIVLIIGLALVAFQVIPNGAMAIIVVVVLVFEMVIRRRIGG